MISWIRGPGLVHAVEIKRGGAPTPRICEEKHGPAHPLPDELTSYFSSPGSAMAGHVWSDSYAMSRRQLVHRGFSRRRRRPRRVQSIVGPRIGWPLSGRPTLHQPSRCRPPRPNGTRQSWGHRDGGLWSGRSARSPSLVSDSRWQIASTRRRCAGPAEEHAVTSSRVHTPTQRRARRPTLTVGSGREHHRGVGVRTSTDQATGPGGSKKQTNPPPRLSGRHCSRDIYEHWTVVVHRLHFAHDSQTAGGPAHSFFSDERHNLRRSSNELGGSGDVLGIRLGCEPNLPRLKALPDLVSVQSPRPPLRVLAAYLPR